MSDIVEDMMDCALLLAVVVTNAIWWAFEIAGVANDERITKERWLLWFLVF